MTTACLIADAFLPPLPLHPQKIYHSKTVIIAKGTYITEAHNRDSAQSSSLSNELNDIISPRKELLTLPFVVALTMMLQTNPVAALAEEVDFSFSIPTQDPVETRLTAGLDKIARAPSDMAVVRSAAKDMVEALTVPEDAIVPIYLPPSLKREAATRLAELKAVGRDSWSENDMIESYGFLKRQLDPYHIVELQGYLSVLPFVGVSVYALLIGVQKFLPAFFPAAYIISAVLLFGRAIVVFLFD